LVRELFGNPFRPVQLSRRERTRDVLTLARAIYDDRAFEQMPVLADALEDAGCTEAQFLDHCRQGRPHALGCWALDAVLERR
jgi:hypothetical protein